MEVLNLTVAAKRNKKKRMNKLGWDVLGLGQAKVGADIVKRALSYPLKLIAKNAGVNGSVVSEKVLSSDNTRYGYNAATGKYEDLMSAGIIDPTKVFNSTVIAANHAFAERICTLVRRKTLVWGLPVLSLQPEFVAKVRNSGRDSEVCCLE